MKKTVYTLNVNNFAPGITKLTYPLMKRWAQKIGADFYIITERKYPEWPIVYEKLQIKELSALHGNDWNIFWDSDALIHPDFFDPTEVVTKDVTISNGTDFVPIRFKPDKYFRRDGRFIGKGNWCLMASDWCTDLWNPLDDLTPEEAEKRITPTIEELATVILPAHLIDDFTISRNIARYGLKHVLIPQIAEMFKAPQGYLWHEYLSDIPKKEINMRRQIMIWAGSALVDVPNRQDVLNKIGMWDGSAGWADFLQVIPAGDRIIAMIKSWGIEI